MENTVAEIEKEKEKEKETSATELDNTAVKNPTILEGALDWKFQRYLTMQLLPIFYILLVAAAILAVVATIIAAFMVSTTTGIFALCVAPLGLFFVIAIIRATLEYLVMAHRIMLIVENMSDLPDQVGDLAGRVDSITSHVDQLIEHVDGINNTLMDLRPLIRSANLPGRVVEVLRGSRQEKRAKKADKTK